MCYLLGLSGAEVVSADLALFCVFAVDVSVVAWSVVEAALFLESCLLSSSLPPSEFTGEGLTSSLSKLNPKELLPMLNWLESSELFPVFAPLLEALLLVSCWLGSVMFEIFAFVFC